MPSQNFLIDVIDRDARVFKPKVTLPEGQGRCSGLSIRFIYSAMTGQLQRFKSQTKLLLNNDPANTVKRLQLAHDLNICQEPPSANLVMWQSNYCELLNMMAYQDAQSEYIPLDQCHGKKDNKFSFQMVRTVAFSFSRDQLVKFIKDSIHEGQYIQLTASNHAGAFFLKNGVYYCFEPNIADQSIEDINIIPHDTAEKLVKEMIEQGFFHNFYEGRDGYFSDKGDKFFVEFTVFENQNEVKLSNKPKSTVDLLKACGAWDDFDSKATLMKGKTVIEYLLIEEIEFETLHALMNEKKLGNLTAVDIIQNTALCDDIRVYNFLLNEIGSTDGSWLTEWIKGVFTSAKYLPSAAALQCYIKIANELKNNDHPHFVNLVGSLMHDNASTGLKRCLSYLNPISNQMKLTAAHEKVNHVVLQIIKNALVQQNLDLCQQLFSEWPQVPGLILGLDSLKLFRACASGNAIANIAPSICNEHLTMALDIACAFGNTVAVINLTNHLSTGLSKKQVLALMRSGQDYRVAMLIEQGDLIPSDWQDDHENNLFHTLAEHGLVISLKQLIELKTSVDINKLNKFNRTPLMVACYNKQFTCANLLLAQACELTQVDSDGCHVLHLAVSNTSHFTQNNIDEVKNFVAKVLVKEPSLLNKKDKKENTLLHLVCHLGHPQLVSQLLEQENSDLYLVNAKRNTVLHEAVDMNRQDVVDLLIQHEKTSHKYTHAKLPTMRNFKSLSALHLACKLGDDAMVNRLRNYWAGHKNDATASRSLLPLSEACLHESLSLATDLIETWGEDVNGVDGALRPIFSALIAGNTPITELLIRRKKASVAWVEQKNNWNLFLSKAVQSGKLSLLELLLMNLVRPAEISATDSIEVKKQKELFKISFIEDINQALILAIQRHRFDMMRSIVSYDCLEVNFALVKAVDDNIVQAVKILLTSPNYDLFEVDENGNTMLHRACMKLSVEIVLLLCQAKNEKSAKKDLFSMRNKSTVKNQLGKTALEIVDFQLNTEKAKAPYGDAKIIEKCLEIKAALGAVNNPILTVKPRALLAAKNNSDPARAVTSVHLASVNSDKKALELVIKAGNAPLNVQDLRGNTPLMIAAMLNDTETVKMLIAAKASTEIVNDEGLSAVDFAIRHNNKDLLCLFKMTDLHAALYANDPARVKALLYEGHFSNISADTKKELLEIAKNRCVQDIRTLIQNAKGNSPVHLAVLCNDENGLKFILAKKFRYDDFDDQGKLPIQVARNIGNVKAVEILQNEVEKKEKLIGTYHAPLKIVEFNSFLRTHTPGRSAIAKLCAAILPNYIFKDGSVFKTTLAGDHRGLTVSFGAENFVYADRLAVRLQLHYGFNYVRSENGNLHIDCDQDQSEQHIDNVHREIGIFLFDVCNTKLIAEHHRGFSYLRDLYCAPGARESGVTIDDPNEVAKLQCRFTRVHINQHGDNRLSFAQLITQSATTLLKGSETNSASQSTDANLQISRKK